MDENELLKKAELLKEEGNFLLKDSNLVDFLSQYGQVTISGSFGLNLLVNGDIDFRLVPFNFSKIQAIEIHNELIRQDYFRGFYFGDYIENPKDGFPLGYYLGLNKIYKGEFWKFDIWYMNEIEKDKENFMDFIEANITPELRYEILKLKQERNEKKQDILSVDIYKSVFEKAGYKF